MARANKQVGAYILVHENTGLKYVGSSADLDGRMSSHLYALRHDKHYRADLQEAFNKDPTVKMLKFPTNNRDEAYQREGELLQEHKDCSNLVNRSLDPYSSRGVIPTEETRKKLSEKRQGRVFSEETKQKISAAHKGVAKSEHAKENMRLAQMKLLRDSPKSLERLLANTVKQSKPITVDGITYPSLHEASRQLGIHRATVKKKATL